MSVGLSDRRGFAKCENLTVARGYFTHGQGNPDESRGARPVLKDNVMGKLLYCHPPPGITPEDFNAETRDLVRLRLLDKVRLKRAPVTRVGKNADTFVHLPGRISRLNDATNTDLGTTSVKSSRIDATFFDASDMRAVPNFKGKAAGEGAARLQMFPHQKMAAPDGSALPGGLRTAGGMPSSKKHSKGNKRIKQRSGGGYE